MTWTAYQTAEDEVDLRPRPDTSVNGAGQLSEEGVAQDARRLVLHHFADGEASSTARLAERLEVTPSHLCHAYRNAWGTTIGADVRRLRIELAKRLLADGSLSIKQVAARVGYEQATYRAFFNAFCGEAGMPPSRYRRRLRSKLRERETAPRLQQIDRTVQQIA